MLMMATLLTVSFVAVGAESSVSPKLLKAEDLRAPVEQAALQRQFDSLSGMQLERLEYSPRGPVKLLRGNTGLVLPTTVRSLKKGDPAPQVLRVLKDLLLAEGTESAVVHSNLTVEDAAPVLRLSEVIDGIPVYAGRIAIEYDPVTLRVSGISALFIPDRNLPRKPGLSARQAEQRVPGALQAAGLKGPVEIREGSYLAYFADASGGYPTALVWVVPVVVGSMNESFLVDAFTGEILLRESEETTVATCCYNAINQSPTIPDGLESFWTKRWPVF